MHERSAIITLVNHLPGAKSIWRWLARERSSMYLTRAYNRHWRHQYPAGARQVMVCAQRSEQCMT